MHVAFAQVALLHVGTCRHNQAQLRSDVCSTDCTCGEDTRSLFQPGCLAASHALSISFCHIDTLRKALYGACMRRRRMRSRGILISGSVVYDEAGNKSTFVWPAADHEGNVKVSG